MLCSSFGFEWPVNLAIANPNEGGSSLVVVVGDDTDAFVMDLRTRNHVHRLKGHLDYSFAASWHPSDGHTVATGNQVGASQGACSQTSCPHAWCEGAALTDPMRLTDQSQSGCVPKNRCGPRCTID